MMSLKNLFGRTSTKNTRAIDTANDTEGDNKDCNIAGRDVTAISDISHSNIEVIVNNYYETSNKKTSKDDIQRYIKAYLYSLMDVCASLEWFGQVDDELQDDKTSQVKLDCVYTALLTTTPTKADAENNSRNKQVYSAVEMLNRHDNLVIAGVAGSGKSAFVNFVALCMAGELLEDKHCNLALLTQPLPDKEGKPQKEKQEWQHGALIPLRIILREFVSSEYFPTEDTEIGAQPLLDFIKALLIKETHKNYYPILESCLLDGEVLVMFDGLDEVPDADKRRERMKLCIEAFRVAHCRNRFLMTVRPYAYEKPKWKNLKFVETELANFSHGQICLFIDSWYQDYDKLELKVVEKRTGELKKIIFANDKLEELAERPLLLTFMAFLHRNRHELPTRRAGLYKELLQLLMDKWEKAHFGAKDSEEALGKHQYTLSEFLRVGFDEIRRVLEQLAFNAHALEKIGTKKTADISESSLIIALAKLAEEKSDGVNPDINAQSLRNHLRDRVGILNLRGGDNQAESVYSFPHRSFQEYLAAAYFDRGEDAMYKAYEVAEDDWEWADLAAYLGKTEPDRWREVIILAGAIGEGKSGTTNLIKALIDDNLLDENWDKSLSVAQSWGLRLAAEILAENINQNRKGRPIISCQKKLQRLLPELLVADTLNASERVAAGKCLAKIGESRAELLEVDNMQFCLIPSGEFYLGSEESDVNWISDKKQQVALTNIEYCYAMARYPVTVTQYRQFVEATNHQMENPACLKGLDNAPVVDVSWDESIKFCDWLTEHWKEKGYLPEGWRVDLPSEPEWEKAAKGGLQIPLEAKKRVISTTLIEQLHENIELITNPVSKRLYPWGCEINIEKLNYGESRINDVSTLGCYPLGKSPYACEEMSGNVWEWTRSAYEDIYPVNVSEWEQRNARDISEVRRVLRGGSFSGDDDGVRCAARLFNTPVGRNSDLGLRVVLSPYL